MGEVSKVIDNYDDKSLLLIDLIDFWQIYKQKHTHTGGLQNIEIWGVGLSIDGKHKQFVVDGGITLREDLKFEGGPKTPLHTMYEALINNIFQ